MPVTIQTTKMKSDWESIARAYDVTVDQLKTGLNYIKNYTVVAFRAPLRGDLVLFDIPTRTDALVRVNYIGSSTTRHLIMKPMPPADNNPKELEDTGVIPQVEEKTTRELRPVEIYRDETPDSLRKWLHDHPRYEVVDFRVPLAGDQYIPRDICGRRFHKHAERYTAYDGYFNPNKPEECARLIVRNNLPISSRWLNEAEWTKQ